MCKRVRYGSNQMNVLVTGGAGYIGSIVSRELLARGHDVCVLDVLRYGGASLLELHGQERFNCIQADIRDREAVKAALEGRDAVVHLAALVGDPLCSRQPELARAINEEASLQLFALSQQAGIQRFVFASTCSNYGRMRDPSMYVNEDSELRPVSLYAETKVVVERALLQSAQPTRPVVTILRFATVFGLSPRMRFDLTVNEFTMELLVKRTLTIFGEQFWRPYLHVRDAAQAVRLVLDAPAQTVQGQAFNVGDTSQNYQKGVLAELIRRLVGNHGQIERVHTDEDPRDYRVSFDKIRRDLGFQMTRTVEDGAREVMAAIRDGVVTDVDNPSYRN